MSKVRILLGALILRPFRDGVNLDFGRCRGHDSRRLYGIPGAIAIVIAVVVLVFFLLPLVGAVLELSILLVLLGSGIAGRVFLRRPWVIEAVNLDDPERSALFAVGGWRQSRQAMEGLARTIPAAGVPRGPSGSAIEVML